MVRAAAVTAVRPTAVAAASTVRRSAAVIAAAASTTIMRATASTTAAVRAAATSATVTATAMLRKCGRRAKQRHRSDCSEEKPNTSGPFHVCTLHPTTSQAMRAAGTPEPFYSN
jgi:hypothetical protein